MAVDKSMKILVVDDYPHVVEMIQDLLRDFGFRNLDGASSGEQALDKLRTEPYGLVISDWKMAPMDGYELLRRVRAEAGLEGLPFLMVAGEAQAGQVVAARDAGVNGFMGKPFTRATLKQKMTALIGVF